MICKNFDRAINQTEKFNSGFFLMCQIYRMLLRFDRLIWQRNVNNFFVLRYMLVAFINQSVDGWVTMVAFIRKREKCKNAFRLIKIITFGKSLIFSCPKPMLSYSIVETDNLVGIKRSANWCLPKFWTSFMNAVCVTNEI